MPVFEAADVTALITALVDPIFQAFKDNLMLVIGLLIGVAVVLFLRGTILRMISRALKALRAI